MSKNLSTILMMILILLGIIMSILNFSMEAYASPESYIWGTMKPGDGTLAESIWYLAGRYIGTFGGNRYYCCEDASNCVIVFAN
ncbi:MAG: hypothetical protein C0168_10930 [Candidatus Aminicenantes bacterium]|nr:MAG: hypothetical protein C0168_10930 [Candidatus Aminicenantes bacterium]